MGTDIPAPTGTPIKVVADGQVRGTGWDIYSGFFVAVDHAGNWTTRYRHLYGQSPVIRGQQVSQGQVIGTVGSTGWSTGPHLHIDLWNVNSQSPEALYKAGWWAHDPELYLGQEDEDDMTPEQMKELKDYIGHQGQQRNEQHNTIEDLVRGQGIQRDEQHEAIRDLVSGSVGGLSPADLKQIAEAVADEQARRLQE